MKPIIFFLLLSFSAFAQMPTMNPDDLHPVYRGQPVIDVVGDIDPGVLVPDSAVVFHGGTSMTVRSISVPCIVHIDNGLITIDCPQPQSTTTNEKLRGAYLNSLWPIDNPDVSTAIGTMGYPKSIGASTIEHLEIKKAEGDYPLEGDSSDLIKVKVRAVHDGDSYRVEFPDKHLEWVRIIGIDAPEVFSPYVLKGQPWGVEAGNVARSELKGKMIMIDTMPTPNNRDQYGRLLVEAYTDNKLIALSLVERGLAWHVHVYNRKHPNINALVKNAQKSARRSQIGLFGAAKRALRPETWRKRYHPGVSTLANK